MDRVSSRGGAEQGETLMVSRGHDPDGEPRPCSVGDHAHFSEVVSSIELQDLGTCLGVLGWWDKRQDFLFCRHLKSMMRIRSFPVAQPQRPPTTSALWLALSTQGKYCTNSRLIAFPSSRSKSALSLIYLHF